MIVSDDVKYNLFMRIANKAKNNYDREAYIDLNEININRCEDNQIELMNLLREQEDIISVVNSGHCLCRIKVNENFVNMYSTEG